MINQKYRENTLLFFLISILFAQFTLQTSLSLYTDANFNICTDFDSYACNNFPKDKSNWFLEATKSNKEIVHRILQSGTYIFDVNFNLECKKSLNVQIQNRLLREFKKLAIENPSAKLRIVSHEGISYGNVCRVRFSLEGTDDVGAMARIVHQLKSARNSSILSEYVSGPFMSAEDKMRYFYGKCHAAHHMNREKKGIKFLRAEIKRIVKPLLHNSAQIGFCRDYPGHTEMCERFSRALRRLNYIGGNPFFIPKILNTVKFNINEGKILSLIQPHFIGSYSEKDKNDLGNCKGDLNIDFENLEYDEENDGETLRKFRSIARIMAENIDDETMERMITLEKRLFAFSLDEKTMADLEKLEESVSMSDFSTLKTEFAHSLNFPSYLGHILKKNYNDREKEFPIALICPSYFHALKKLLRTTPRKVLATYTALSSFSHIVRKIPFVLPPHQRNFLHRNRSLHCTILAEYFFPHPFGHLFAEKLNLEEKMRTITEMVSGIKSSFSTIISRQDWITASSKRKIKEKIQNIKSVIGVHNISVPVKQIDSLYSSVKIEPTFVQMYTLLFKQSLHREESCLNHREENSPSIVFPNEANAYYDFRDNDFYLKTGLLRSPFIGNHTTPLKLYSQLGVVIAHEITHSIGLRGIMFGSDGIFSSIIDDATMAAYKNRIQKLSSIVEEKCAYDIKYKFPRKKTVHKVPKFKEYAEEIIADIGGVKVALLAYRNYLTRNSDTAISAEDMAIASRHFFKMFSKIFCETPLQSVLEKQNGHPLGFCRLRVISLLTDFGDAFQCKARDREDEFNFFT